MGAPGDGSTRRWEHQALLHPPASRLLSPVIDAAFLFVFAIRGESTLIYIKW
jgi:hypothetical protein